MATTDRAAIRRLRAGVVPSWTLERLSVGYEKIKRRIDGSLEEVLNEEHVHPLFVQGEWGIGKTHLLSYVRASAASLGVPCIKLDLDATSITLNYPQRIYAVVAEQLRHEGFTGLRSVLTHHLLKENVRAALARFADSSDSGDLSWPLQQLCRAAEQPERLFEEQYAWTTLLGLDLSWSNYAYKRRAALSRIRALARMFAAVGLGGLVVLFDEAETIDQLWNVRSRATAYATIGGLCQARALWCVFGITKRFERTVDDDLRRLSGGLSIEPDGEWFLANWRDRYFQVTAPPGLHDGLGPEIAMRVATLYADAYGMRIDQNEVSKCVQEWASNPARNPRRLIRLVVEKLDKNRLVRTGV